MRTLRDNKKGMYEYVLTKSVMLLFVISLVGIFTTLKDNVEQNSATEIAQAEARRIAKEIDDAIGFKGVSNKVTIHLDNTLKVGQNIQPYIFNITETGIVIIDFTQFPYSGPEVSGVSKFGIDLERVGGTEQIDCLWNQIRNGASFTVDKKSEYEYRPQEDKLYLIVKVTIDASDSCYDRMVFQQEFVE
jgi:hypothetical protein